MKFSEKLIKLRKRHGFTQETFANEVGVSRQSVYKWENGTSYPEVEKLLKIARTLEITVDDLLNDEWDLPELPDPKKAKKAAPAEEAAPEAEAEAEAAAEAPAETPAEAPAGPAPAGEEPAKEAETTPAEAPKEEPAEEKRGFFSRLFRRK